MYYYLTVAEADLLFDDSLPHALTAETIIAFGAPVSRSPDMIATLHRT